MSNSACRILEAGRETSGKLRDSTFKPRSLACAARHVYSLCMNTVEQQMRAIEATPDLLDRALQLAGLVTRRLSKAPPPPGFAKLLLANVARRREGDVVVHGGRNTFVPFGIPFFPSCPVIAERK